MKKALGSLTYGLYWSNCEVITIVGRGFVVVHGIMLLNEET